jgi:hypothetical protein
VSDVGRNDPCPCGSGKKYKRCHLAIDSAAGSIHDMDHDLTAAMYTFASELVGEPWLDPDEIDPDSLPFLLPFTFYSRERHGRSLAEEFAEAEGESLQARMRSWLAAQLEAWLSVWEVQSVEPGRRVRLRDVLTGVQRDVLELTASSQLVVHHHVLARVVGFEGESYLAGMHPFPLAPLAAADVIDGIRRQLRVKHRVSPERLQGARATGIVVRAWDDMIHLLVDRAERGPALSNTDGDPLVIVTDRFALAAEDRARVAAAIRGMPDVDGGVDDSFILLRNKTILATISLTARALKVESLSLRRADAVRDEIEAACGELLRFKGRGIIDPLSERAREAAGPPVPLPKASPEAMAYAREWKRNHYAAWGDEPLPALGGKTPREAMSTARGRAKVEALLREFEHHEAKLDPDERVDFAEVRRDLGLD